MGGGGMLVLGLGLGHAMLRYSVGVGLGVASPCHAMGVPPSTHPVAALGSSFVLSSFDG